MSEPRAFTPDWVSPPGETIEDLLDERGWTQAEFAQRTGFTPEHVNDLVKGRAVITSDTALRLEAVLGSTADFWLAREARYREAVEDRPEFTTQDQRPSLVHVLPRGGPPPAP